MGLHSSLKRAEKSASTRSVMKRTERIKWLKAKGMWSGDKVLGLPKIKALKLKGAKKAVKEKVEEAKPAAGAAAPAAASAKGPASAKPGAQAKPAAQTKPQK